MDILNYIFRVFIGSLFIALVVGLNIIIFKILPVTILISIGIILTVFIVWYIKYAYTLGAMLIDAWNKHNGEPFLQKNDDN